MAVLQSFGKIIGAIYIRGMDICVRACIPPVTLFRLQNKALLCWRSCYTKTAPMSSSRVVLFVLTSTLSDVLWLRWAKTSRNLEIEDSAEVATYLDRQMDKAPSTRTTQSRPLRPTPRMSIGDALKEVLNPELIDEPSPKTRKRTTRTAQVPKRSPSKGEIHHARGRSTSQRRVTRKRSGSFEDQDRQTAYSQVDTPPAPEETVRQRSRSTSLTARAPRRRSSIDEFAKVSAQRRRSLCLGMAEDASAVRQTHRNSRSNSYVRPRRPRPQRRKTWFRSFLRFCSWILILGFSFNILRYAVEEKCDFPRIERVFPTCVAYKRNETLLDVATSVAGLQHRLVVARNHTVNRVLWGYKKLYLHREVTDLQRMLRESGLEDDRL